MAGSVLAVFKAVSTRVPAWAHHGAVEFGLFVKLLACKLFPLLAKIELEVCTLVFVCDDALCHQLLVFLLLLVALPFLCGLFVLGIVVVGLIVLGVDYSEQEREGCIETAHHYVPVVGGKVE